MEPGSKEHSHKFGATSLRPCRAIDTRQRSGLSLRTNSEARFVGCFAFELIQITVQSSETERYRRYGTEEV